MQQPTTFPFPTSDTELTPATRRPSALCLATGLLLFTAGIYLVALGNNLAPLLLATGTFTLLTGWSMVRANRTGLPRERA